MNLRKALFAAGAGPVLVLTLVACGSDGAGNGAGGAKAGPLIVEEVGDFGQVYVDAGGRAVYVAEEEKSGGVLCTESCLQVWEPVLATDDPVGGDFDTITRPDTEETQLTYQGAPVYTFAPESAGEVTGDGITDVFGGTSFTWHVVGPAPGEMSDSPDTEQGPRYGY